MHMGARRAGRRHGPRGAALAGALAALVLSSLPACMPAAVAGPSPLRLRGGSSPYRTGGLWGSPAEPKMSADELKKNMQSLLEKHASGVMGRDLRRLFKEVLHLPCAMPPAVLPPAALCQQACARAACRVGGGVDARGHSAWESVRSSCAHGTGGRAHSGGVGSCPVSLRAVGLTAQRTLQVNGKELPLNEFGVQRPIELVEKELTDTVYYTREVSCRTNAPGRMRATRRLLTVLRAA
jgi:hypothetical protein